MGTKDASSTDITVHGGRALTSFYLCGDPYAMDPVTLDQHGAVDWDGAFPQDWGACSHPKVDERTGEMLFFNYSTEAPYLHFGVVSPDSELVHYALLERGLYVNRWHPDMPARFAIVPRRGGARDVRWFEVAPTNVLHWINAYEDGDEVVLDGFHQGCPDPRREDDDRWTVTSRYLDANELRTRPYRWRFDLRTGATTEGPLDDACLEFGMLNGGVAGRPYRYTWAMTAEPGWFLFNGLVRFDTATAQRQEWRFPKGVFASESPMAPRPHGSGAEDDGYVVTFVSDMNTDTSECQVFDAADVGAGPVARVLLPERISSGTHTVWAPEESLG